MPRRTNEFQELVSLVRKSLARHGDTVEDSAMVSVQGLETKREIDILHKTSDGFTTIKIAVEAKDEGRPLDLTTFEQLAAKYRGEGRVCVDKFIVVSRNGFTEGVREKARLMDVPLMTLDEAREADWAGVCPTCPGDTGPGTARFQMAPHFHEVRVVPPLPPDKAGAILREGKVLCRTCVDGHDHGTLVCYAWARTLGRQDEGGKTLREQLAAKAREHPSGALMQIGQPLCPGVRVRHDGVDYPMQELHVAIHSVDSIAPVRCTPYRLDSSDGPGRVFPHFQADFGDTKVTWVMPDGMASPRMTLNIARKTPTRAERRKNASVDRKAGKKKR